MIFLSLWAERIKLKLQIKIKGKQRALDFY